MYDESLVQAYYRAEGEWPFIHHYEGQFDLPDCLLFAVGWRETRLVNCVGDGGHGHGVWQLDDRSHLIPSGFDLDVAEQCATAAAMLQGTRGMSQFGLMCRLAAYNAGAGAVATALKNGQSPDSVTTGGNYAGTVVAALLTLHPLHIAEVTRSRRAAAPGSSSGGA